LGLAKKVRLDRRTDRLKRPGAAGGEEGRDKKKAITLLLRDGGEERGSKGLVGQKKMDGVIEGIRKNQRRERVLVKA